MAARIPSDDLAKLILRLAVGGLLILHGIHKVTHGIAGIQSMVVQAHLPEWLAYGIYIGEIIAPFFLIIGFKTRISGLIVAFTMAMAVYLAHRQNIFGLEKHGGSSIELNLLFMGGALALGFLGGGKFSVSKD